MDLRALEFLISKKISSLPELRNCSRIYYRLKNIAKPGSTGRNEDGQRQNRNSILSFYVDQHKCQAFLLRKNKAWIFINRIRTSIKSRDERSEL